MVNTTSKERKKRLDAANTGTAKLTGKTTNPLDKYSNNQQDKPSTTSGGTTGGGATKETINTSKSLNQPNREFIDFTKEGEVTVDRGGIKRTLSKEQYDNYLQSQRGLGRHGGAGFERSQEVRDLLDPTMVQEGALQTGLQEMGALDLPSAPQREQFLPVVGQTVIDQARKDFDKRFATATDEEIAKAMGWSLDAFQNAPTETVRDRMLLDVRKKRYEEGLNAAEEFGAVFEKAGSLNLFGISADPWINRPEEVTEDIFAALEPIDDAMSQVKSDVALGELEPEDAIRQIEDYEVSLAKYQAKLQLVLNSSVTLQSKPEAIDKVEEKILKAQERLRSTRVSVIAEVTRRSTGTGTSVPTDEQLAWDIINSRK